jgi:predicted RNA-binding Zn ribbon-like protein
VSRVPADDATLRLAVALCNTYDLMNDPADYLTMDRLRRMASGVGVVDLIAGLRAADLEALRSLRGRVYRVFAEPEPAGKVAALNALLAGEQASAELVAAGDGEVRLALVGGQGGVGRLSVRFADAIARALICGSPDRFGVCAAEPCRGVYLDRTRAGRQRYCCDQCNDRIASAAYRQRNS